MDSLLVSIVGVSAVNEQSGHDRHTKQPAGRQIHTHR